MSAPHPYVVPTDQLADLIGPLIDQLDASLTVSDNRNKTPNQGNGALNILGERIGPRLGVQADGVPRRIYDIRQRRSYCTGTELADALLLELGVNINNTDLPTLAGNLAGALDMVDCWADDHEPEMPPLERKRLAKQLLRFSDDYMKAAAPIETKVYLKYTGWMKTQRNQKAVAA